MLVIFANPVLKKTQTDPAQCSFETTGLVYKMFIKDMAFFCQGIRKQVLGMADKTVLVG